MDGISTSINSILKNLIKNFNTLLDCPVRYAGDYDGHKIHYFIEYIEYYKRIKCITDKQALQELQYLLIDHAHTWWLRRKSSLTTWSEALTSLENHYSKQRRPHIIFKEIFKHTYADYNVKENFVDDKNELFNELPQPKLTEKNQLEMIYALLPNDIQTKVNFENIINLNDLKEQLKNLECDKGTNTPEEANTFVDANNTEVNVLNDTVNETESCNEHQQSAVNDEENNTSSDTHERDPIIKVRRTEDLMPSIKNEEERNNAQHEEFIENNVPTTNNNASQNSNENFQIDSDIMNQINNIIDESEMNMDTLHHNQHIPTIISRPPDSASAIAFLLRNIQSELLTQKHPEPKSKQTQATKKGKLRCSFCRRFNHTSQTCLKKAKQMKLFPERFMTPNIKKKSDDPQISIKEVTVESLTSTNNNNNATISTPTTEPLINTQSVLNYLPATLPACTPTITPHTVITVSSSFNNVPEKCINPTLTTKLIAPINGPAPNKILAAKLRSINSPMPKCHQCGAVGFYKSICPNCSPIYNNNQYKQ